MKVTLTQSTARPNLCGMSEADVLRRLFEAYNRGDVDGVVAHATDDVTYVAGGRGLRVHGRDNWRAVVADIASALPGRRAQLGRIAAVDGTGLVEWVIEGTSSGSGKGLPPAGTPVRFEGCSVVEFHDSKISYWRDYVD